MIYLPAISFLLLLSYVSFLLLKDVNTIKKMEAWKTTEALIKDSRIVELLNGSKKSKIRVYFFCTYNVDGVEYGTKSISNIKLSNMQLRRAISKIKDKDHCTIYYNPKRPHEASLLGSNQINFFWKYLQVAFISIGLILSLYFVV